MTLMTLMTLMTPNFLTHKTPKNIWRLQIKFVPLQYEKIYCSINRTHEHDHLDGQVAEERHAAHRGDHRRPRSILSL